MKYILLLAVLALTSCARVYPVEIVAGVTAVPTPAGRIVGYVRNAEGTGLGGATVTARTDTLAESTTSIAGGWFGLNVADGTWLMQATMTGYVCADQIARIQNSEKVTLLVQCSPGTPEPTVTSTPTMATTPADGVALHLCPDPDRMCSQVWLAPGAATTWHATCPSGRVDVIQFCLVGAGQWTRLEQAD